MPPNDPTHTPTAPAGAPSHLELGVPDASVSRAFFAGLLGWADRPMPHESFYAATPTVGVGMHGHDDDRTIVVYFAVDDIESAVERVRALGGTSDDPGPAIEGFGRFVECRDPQGVRFGLHQRR